MPQNRSSHNTCRQASIFVSIAACVAALSYRSNRVNWAQAKSGLALPMTDAVWLPLVWTAAANDKRIIVSRLAQATV